MRFWASSISNRFLLVFAGAGALILVAVAIGYSGVSASVDEFRRVAQQELNNERAVTGMVGGFKKQVQEWKNVLLRGADAKQREKYWGKFQKEEAKIQTAAESLINVMPASEARSMVEDFLKSHREMGVAYRAGFKAFVDAGFNAASGDMAVKGIDRAPTTLLEKAAATIALTAKSATEGSLDRAAASAMTAVLVTIAALLIGVFALVFFLKRFVLQPMGVVGSSLDRLAEGDFTVEIELDREDELGNLANSARHIRDDLGELLRNIVVMAHDLDQAGTGLATLSEQNREQLNTQQDGTSQVATASEELAATAQEVAGSAAGAAEAAHAAQQSTKNGMQVVEQAIESINLLETDVTKVNQVLTDLEAHSGAIGNVLNVIRGIAEQTNLLALNAAIEAARAGEQGRGFAVVADEVRSLAQRTQESTQEIQLTIEQLQEGAVAAVQAMEHGQGRVSEGVARTLEVGQSLQDIAASVTTIVDMNTQIATAAEEQGAVAGDVSRNVNAVDGSSQNLVASAERVAETSRNIAELSTRLAEASARFQV
jgi:methyl-accepting chemotaxis protein